MASYKIATNGYLGMRLPIEKGKRIKREWPSLYIAVTSIEGRIEQVEEGKYRVISPRYAYCYEHTGIVPRIGEFVEGEILFLISESEMVMAYHSGRPYEPILIDG